MTDNDVIDATGMDTPEIGHNQPPESIADKIRREHDHQFARITELIESAERVPERINDEETHKKALELFKMMRVAFKTADETRKIEKEPHMAIAKEIDGTFAKATGPLKKWMDEIKSRAERFAEMLKERERLAREEKAKREREEAERREREAREAERRRIEAERREREAREAAERAQKEREEAERRAREERERAEEAKRRAAAERQRAREAEEEAEREAAKRAEAEARREREAAENRAREEREKAQRELEARREAEEQERAAKRDAKVEKRLENESIADAVNAEKRAEKFDRKANAGSAELSRSKSDRGVTGSLSDQWVAHIHDYDAIPLDKIRGFINQEAISKAVNLFVKAGGRELAGVTIEKENNLRIV